MLRSVPKMILEVVKGICDAAILHLYRLVYRQFFDDSILVARPYRTPTSQRLACLQSLEAEVPQGWEFLEDEMGELVDI